MARYIDAEKLDKEGWSASRTYPQDAHTMVYETKKMTDFPSADVVEVVLCKECKYSHPWYADRRICEMWSETGASVFNNDYCSRGERRTDNG